MKGPSEYTFSKMRKIALGKLLYTPARFGSMQVGDFIDALCGYIEGQNDIIKSFAELLRIQTSILWNVQVGKDNQLSPAELWPFSWDDFENGTAAEVSISEEELKAFRDRQADILMKL